MGLNYPLQDPKILFQDVTLTDTYTDNSISPVWTRGYAETTIFIAYTPAVDGSSFQLLFEGSPDGLDSVTPIFYQQTRSSISGGTNSLVNLENSYTETTVADTEYDFFFLLPPNAVLGRYSIKETSSGAFGTATVTLLAAGR